MKRVLILSLVFMLLMGLNTFATQTRTLTMGDNDGIMVDDYNIFRFPGRLFSYPNIAVAEFATTGGADFQQFGVNWKFGDESPWVLGTYFRNNNFAIIPRDYFGNNLTSNNYPNQFGLFPGPTDPAVINNLDMENHRMNLLYGRKLGTNDFGFQFEYIRSSYARDFNDTSATPINYDVTEEKFGQYTFMFGLTEGGTGQWDLAAGVTLGSWTDKNALDSTESKPDGYYDLWAEGRYFWVQNPTITLVPHGMFVVGSRGVKNLNNVNDPNDDFTANNDRFMLEGGIGMNYTPSSNLLAVMDFGFMYGNVKTEFKYVDPLDNEEFKSTRLLPSVMLTRRRKKRPVSGLITKSPRSMPTTTPSSVLRSTGVVSTSTPILIRKSFLTVSTSFRAAPMPMI
jgi:hypothetical protein